MSAAPGQRDRTTAGKRAVLQLWRLDLVSGLLRCLDVPCREIGQSRGFGFVTMGNVSEGNAAIKGLNGKDKGGRKLTVNEARPKDDRGGRPSPGSRR